MSNQGNIILYPSNTASLGNLYAYPIPIIFTSSRWGGSETPNIARIALKSAYESTSPDTEHRMYYIESDVLREVSELMANPVFIIGNSDTPTVIVSFSQNTVKFQQTHGSKEILKIFSIEEYIALTEEQLYALKLEVGFID